MQHFLHEPLGVLGNRFAKPRRQDSLNGFRSAARVNQFRRKPCDRCAPVEIAFGVETESGLDHAADSASTAMTRRVPGTGRYFFGTCFRVVSFNVECLQRERCFDPRYVVGPASGITSHSQRWGIVVLRLKVSGQIELDAG
jgi:hypothetical protein